MVTEYIWNPFQDTCLAGGCNPISVSSYRVSVESTLRIGQEVFHDVRLDVWPTCGTDFEIFRILSFARVFYAIKA